MYEIIMMYREPVNTRRGLGVVGRLRCCNNEMKTKLTSMTDRYFSMHSTTSMSYWEYILLVLACSWCCYSCGICGCVDAASLLSSTDRNNKIIQYYHRSTSLPLTIRRLSFSTMQLSKQTHNQKHASVVGSIPRGGGDVVDMIMDSSVPLLDAADVADLSHLIEDAYAWCCSLGAPSALVAAAVVATIYENMHSGDLEINHKTDGKWVQLGKKVTRLLLLSAFALETLSIFVTTVTGTMLLSRKHNQMLIENTDVTTPLEFLKENYEFEYLTASITFLQGLMHWLAAIGLGHVLPSPHEGPDTPTEIALSKFIAWGMGALILLMISFYNNHITFYNNYGSMLLRWFYVMMHGHVFGIGTFPPRPLSVLLMITVATSLYYGYISLSRSEGSTNDNTN